jgi:SagB-type dehydrogenase family enzyme
MVPSAGHEFHAKSGYVRGKLPSHTLDWASKPATFKEYPGKETVALPPPETSGGPGIWESLRRRRSVRAYSQTPVTKQELSQLLWATQGITAELRDGLRAAPSAGALYPIETYVCANRVTDLEQGLYHYDVRGRKLEVLKKGDLTRAVAAAALDQEMAARCAVVFIWSAVFPRSAWKYLDRAYRYAYMDVGHIAENMALAADAIGLSTCQIGAFYDNEMDDLIEADGVQEAVIYMSSVGRAAKK